MVVLDRQEWAAEMFGLLCLRQPDSGASGATPKNALGRWQVAAVIEDVGAMPAEGKIVRLGVDVLEVAPPFAVSGLLDLAFQFSQQAFIVVHRVR